MKFAVVIAVAILALTHAKYYSKESSEERSESHERGYGHHRGHTAPVVTRESFITTTGPTMTTHLPAGSDRTTGTSSPHSTGGTTTDLFTQSDTTTPTRPETTTESSYITPQFTK
ncbi:hypothetical protein Aduo_014425 [Ancylostoma duodenale]